MKKIFFYLITIFSSAMLEAQETAPPYFDTCQYLQQLEGEWMFKNGDDTVRIYLRYHRNFNSDTETYNSTLDELWGWVEYKRGNTIILSDYANRLAPLPYNLDDLPSGLRSIVIISNGACTNPPTALYGSFYDLNRCRQRKVVNATVNPQGTRMTWKISQPTAMLDNLWCAGITLPQEFTLTKQ